MHASTLGPPSPPLGTPHDQGDQTPAREQGALRPGPTSPCLRNAERQQGKEKRTRPPEQLRRGVDPERQGRRDEKGDRNERDDPEWLPRYRVPPEEDADERRGEERSGQPAPPRRLGQQERAQSEHASEKWDEKGAVPCRDARHPRRRELIERCPRDEQDRRLPPVWLVRSADTTQKHDRSVREQDVWSSRPVRSDEWGRERARDGDREEELTVVLRRQHGD